MRIWKRTMYETSAKTGRSMKKSWPLTLHSNGLRKHDIATIAAALTTGVSWLMKLAHFIYNPFLANPMFSGGYK